jgi:hypothetical protein
LLQSLFVIRQDLAEIVNEPERTDLIVRARDGVHDAIRSLRAAVFDIHPVVLERGGLGSAVAAVAQHHAALGGLTIDVEVEPEADADAEHARLLLSRVIPVPPMPGCDSGSRMARCGSRCPTMGAASTPPRRSRRSSVDTSAWPRPPSASRR